MIIRERGEGTPLQEGVQVTHSDVADHFYFVHSGDVIKVRLPKDPKEMVTAEVRSFAMDRL